MGPIDESFLWASLLWGSIGGGYLLYGWRQKAPIPLLAGVLLTVLSFFASDALLMSVLSVAVIAGTWWATRYFG